MSTYDQLVCARKSCTRCVGLVNPADSSHAHFDGLEIGPWSRWLASRPAKLILVGQDWGTVNEFRIHRGRDLPDNRTNKRLTEFLSLLDFKVGPADQEDRQSGVFATNAILCLKHGTMSEPVKKEWFNQCRSFLRETIDELSAPVVIALGVYSYQAVGNAYELGLRPFREAVERCLPLELDKRKRAFAVYHPAARPKNRTLDEMRDDWRRIKSNLP